MATINIKPTVSHYFVPFPDGPHEVPLIDFVGTRREFQDEVGKSLMSGFYRIIRTWQDKDGRERISHYTMIVTDKSASVFVKVTIGHKMVDWWTIND